MRELEPYAELEPEMYGFRSGASCQDAHLALQRRLLATASQAEPPTAYRIVSLDLSRAFDSLPHAAILKELQRREVPLRLQHLVLDFLSDRELHVQVGEASSSSYSPGNGVPQGSGLSPLLIALVMTGLHRIPMPPGLLRLSFADDLLYGGPATSAGATELQATMNVASEWIADAGLVLNASKSHFMEIHLRRRQVNEHTPPSPSLAGVALQPAKSLRFLGISLDPHLDFSEHWRSVAADCRRMKGALWRALKSHRPSFRLAYRSIVEGRIAFSLGACPPTKAGDWDKLGKGASLAAHYITNDWRSPRAVVCAKA